MVSIQMADVLSSRNEGSRVLVAPPDEMDRLFVLFPARKWLPACDRGLRVLISSRRHEGASVERSAVAEDLDGVPVPEAPHNFGEVLHG